MTSYEIFETRGCQIFVTSRYNGDPHTDSKSTFDSMESFQKNLPEIYSKMKKVDGKWIPSESYPSGWYSPERRKIGKYTQYP